MKIKYKPISKLRRVEVSFKLMGSKVHFKKMAYTLEVK